MATVTSRLPSEISKGLERPKSFSITPNSERRNQLFGCRLSADGDQCNLCKSLISIPSGSKLNDCQQLSFNVKREGSTSSYNENTKLLRDVLATPPSSRGNTLKTLCSLAEEAVDDGGSSEKPLALIPDSDRKKEETDKIILERNVVVRNMNCFPDTFPADCCFLKLGNMTFSEEEWLSFVQKLNVHCAKMDVARKSQSLSKLSAYFECCFASSAERQKRILRAFINKSNRKIFYPCGLQVGFVDREFKTLELGLRRSDVSAKGLKVDSDILTFPQ
ncbi:unnamed protein product [Enterobius vermicularis]|uniref:Glutaredoxin domain-containing protein n=1 Tax=Enterobius vermicularis TaxID=51028 RepID=A0A0N4V883_ENTVE|nr:unnamed protein product [Enterobius vermicularis]